ncbi:MAG: hypothetical protein AAGC55_07140, partial [Myxococcota bacterium]
MDSRLLIVNCHHHEFKCVPIGSFGLCDYLARHDIPARIFNAALYSRAEYVARLEECVLDYQPSHIGLIIHWKELLENALYLAFALKSRFPERVILCGG